MNVRINQLVKSLLQKDSLDQCSVQELQQFADRNPYFGAAQLLLTKKLQTENAEQYNEQLQKTFLFFHNPLWVEQLLNETGQATITKATPAMEDQRIPPLPVGRNIFPDDNVVPVDDSITAEKKMDGENTVAAEETMTAERAMADEKTIVAEETMKAERTVPEENTVAAEQPMAQGQTVTGEKNFAARDTIGSELTMGTDNHREVELHAPEIEIPLTGSAEKITEIPNPASDSSAGDQVEKESVELIFEPYYTVDYFASQGIKIKEDEIPKDKFGQQLKSFTDWLRTMKRLPLSEIAVTVEPKTERQVDKLAEHSLEEREVVTAAMAEVWEKQGNAARAIEIYNKLSLLDPSKSVYFAAKIEDLKKRI